MMLTLWSLKDVFNHLICLLIHQLRLAIIQTGLNYVTHSKIIWNIKRISNELSVLYQLILNLSGVASLFHCCLVNWISSSILCILLNVNGNWVIVQKELDDWMSSEKFICLEVIWCSPWSCRLFFEIFLSIIRYHIKKSSYRCLQE